MGRLVEGHSHLVWDCNWEDMRSAENQSDDDVRLLEFVLIDMDAEGTTLDRSWEAKGTLSLLF